MSRDLLEAYRSGSADAADELVRKHVGLVRRVVGRLAVPLPPEIDRDDLVEIGLLGLLDAARSFDATRGASFSTFAYITVRGAVLDELRRVDVLPRGKRDALRSYEQARRELQSETGREPTFLEVQDRLGLSADELQDVLRSRTLSQNQGTGEASTGVSPESFSDAGDGDPLALAQAREAQERLVEVLKTLPEREQQVVILYYRGNLLLREIGKVLGITESRTSQILNHALVLLNHRLGGSGEDDV